MALMFIHALRSGETPSCPVVIHLLQEPSLISITPGEMPYPFIKIELSTCEGAAGDLSFTACALSLCLLFLHCHCSEDESHRKPNVELFIFYIYTVINQVLFPVKFQWKLFTVSSIIQTNSRVKDIGAKIKRWHFSILAFFLFFHSARHHEGDHLLSECPHALWCCAYMHTEQALQDFVDCFGDCCSSFQSSFS